MKPHTRKLQAIAPPPTATATVLNRTQPTKEPIIKTPPPPPPPQTQPNQTQQYTSSQPFDSSMALTILVLLTALFFMAFFSLYLRRFSSSDTHFSSGHRRRRSLSPTNTTATTTTTTTTTTTSSRTTNNNRKGADPELIKSLPVYNYCRGEAKYYQVECAICLGEFEERGRVKMIPRCRHVFHQECIERWLVLHVTCPVCRGALFFVSQGCKDVESTVESGDTSAVGERVLSSPDSLHRASSL